MLKVCVKNGPSVTDVWEDTHGQVDWDISHILREMYILYNDIMQSVRYISYTTAHVFIVLCTVYAI